MIEWSFTHIVWTLWISLVHAFKHVWVLVVRICFCNVMNRRSQMKSENFVNLFNYIHLQKLRWHFRKHRNCTLHNIISICFQWYNLAYLTTIYSTLLFSPFEVVYLFFVHTHTHRKMIDCKLHTVCDTVLLFSQSIYIQPKRPHHIRLFQLKSHENCSVYIYMARRPSHHANQPNNVFPIQCAGFPTPKIWRTQARGKQRKGCVTRHFNDGNMSIIMGEFYCEILLEFRVCG